VHPLPEVLLVQLHLLGRDVGELGNVGAPAHPDVGICLLHAGLFPVGDERQLLGARLEQELSHQSLALEKEQRSALGPVGGSNQLLGEVRRDVDRLDQDLLAGLKIAGVCDQRVCQLRIPGIGHGIVTLAM
jgi:hypothetical protein